MVFYKYEAKDQDGKLLKGSLEANDQGAAANILLKKNCIPLSIVESKKVIKQESIDISRLLEPRVGLEELIIFCRQMYALMKAGIPIIRAIVGLAETTTHKGFKETLLDVATQLEQGRNLSTAMTMHKKTFNRLMVSIMLVGENTGKLEEAFLQLATYFEREKETRKQIKSAMRYPTFVIIAIVAAMFILNIFVIPTFAEMFKRFNTELPLMTRILIGTSDFILAYWVVIIVAMITAVFGFRGYIKSKSGRLKWDRIKLKIPLVGSIIERSLLSRYSRSFAMILRAGVPMTTGLTLVSEAVDNAFMEQKVIEMRRNIEKGDSLLRVSKSSGLFTQLVLQMVSVGEETGQVDELLQEAAEFYEREVDFDLKSLTAKIEPILISVVAVMVLVLALGIFTPMWDMMSAIKGK